MHLLILLQLAPDYDKPGGFRVFRTMRTSNYNIHITPVEHIDEI